MTAADLKELSLGYLIDFFNIKGKLSKGADIHADERHFYQMRDMRPLIEEKHKNKQISDERYKKWLANYSELEQVYG